MASAIQIDPLLGADPTDPFVQRAAYAGRAFPRSQELLSGDALSVVGRPVQVTWHDMGLSPYGGAYAVVNDQIEDMTALLGSVVRVGAYGRSVLVAVIASGVMDEDISLARRAYLALAPWNVDPLLGGIEVTYGP